MAKSFSEILSASPETLEASKPLPAGEYEMEVIKADIQELRFDFGDHKEGDEFLAIYAKPVAPVDVDEEELEACENWRNEIVSLRIFPEEMGDRFVDVKSERGFAYDCGLNPSDFDSVEDLIAATVGQHFLGTVTHSPNKNDPNRPYVNLRATAPL
jgi:hypothetical protein